MDDIADNLKMITVDVSEDIKDTNKDENGNIILPKIFKTYKDKDFEIKAYIYDQIRDEQYLNAFNKKELEIIEDGDNLIIKYDDIKDIDYDGKNQFIEINIVDKNFVYWEFEFKYRLNYKILETSELENAEPIELEEESYSENGITNTINIPTKVKEHTIKENNNYAKGSTFTPNETNPKAGDNIAIWVILSGESILVIMSIAIRNLLKKRK